MNEDIKICVYTLEQKAILENTLSKYIVRFNELSVYLPKMSCLCISKDEFKQIFEGSKGRARTRFDKKSVYIDLEYCDIGPDLDVVLLHEISHILQSIKKGPLYFMNWVNLLELDYYCQQTRPLIQSMADRAGIGKEIQLSESHPSIVTYARRIANIFADKDSNSFIVNKNIIPLSSYIQYVERSLNELKRQVSIAENESEKIFCSNMTKHRRKDLLFAQSGCVFADSSSVLGSRWARLSPIIEINEAKDTINYYLSHDIEINKIQSGRFLNKKAIEYAWNHILKVSDNRNEIWKVFTSLALEDVKFTRAIVC